MLEEKKKGPEYVLTKLDIEGSKVAEHSWLYGNKRCTKEIGYITSAMWSPAAKANIALAMIRTEHLGGEIWASIDYEKEYKPILEKQARGGSVGSEVEVLPHSAR